MCLRRVFLGLLLAGLSLWASPALGQVRLIGDPRRDVLQTMQARWLLAADPELQEHNLGVLVRDRVAILWGPAPSAEVAFRAELNLRAMIELVEIRNELFVSDILEPIRRPIKIGDAKRALWGSKAPPTTTTGFGGPILQMPVPIQSLKNNFPPIAAPEFGPPRIQADLSGERDQRLTEAVRAALHGDDRFRAVFFAVKEGRVSLKMTEPDASVLHEAAQTVSRLPHVAAVLVVEKANPR